jgi:hypothetical protein
LEHLFLAAPVDGAALAGLFIFYLMIFLSSVTRKRAISSHPNIPSIMAAYRLGPTQYHFPGALDRKMVVLK